MNHRYRSWEHCYKFFGEENINIDLAALNLGFYLASFGMYRGSSFLLQRDYKFLLPIVELIFKYKELRNSVSIDTTKIFELAEKIRGYFRHQDCNATDTLVTKILLGTLGITPAFDSYFLNGLQQEGIIQNFGTQSMQKLIEYAQKHNNKIAAIQHSIREQRGMEYPVMKIIDMYFWQKGYNSENNK